MAVHIFTMNEENYKICFTKGIVGLPEPKETNKANNVFDGLLSRLSCIKENDYILIYIIKAHELRGVWQADGSPFFDTTEIWSDRVYPFRCKIKPTKYSFKNSLTLNDIRDLQNSNKIWTWALERATGTNAMFSISNHEFDIIINEYLKINRFPSNDWIIMEPYPVHSFNIKENIHKNESGYPQYEYSIMAHLNMNFAVGKYKSIFGNYNDFLSYVPTSLGREMDILLIYEHPENRQQILGYDIIEVKRDVFDEKALSQLIDYESWFLHKKVAGDLNMLSTTAIAKSFSDDVIKYVEQRRKIENKIIKLVEYYCDENGEFNLKCISK